MWNVEPGTWNRNMTYTTTEIARRLNGEVLGDGVLLLTGFVPTDTAKPGDLTFAENDDYLARAERSAASAILVQGEVARGQKTLIRVANARVAMAHVLPIFFPEPEPTPGIDPTAQVAPSAQIDPTAIIGPHCVVGERVKIGPRCSVHGGNHLGADCVLGREVHLFPNAVLYPRTQVGDRVRIHAGAVIGADGFGYVFHEGRHLKVPQVGNVVIQEDVEIGANVTIDCGALGSTIIGQGSKIDNLVQIGHNVVLGPHCILCGQAGIAGSTRLGSYVTIAGQAGLAGHLQIGNQVTIGAQGGVMNNIPDGQKWLGTPAQPDRQMKRVFIGMQRLPELLQRVHQLEKRLAELQATDKAKAR
jgi:UDP-3-O-[3-hydroxymyristoyl] glucosamine N-acyltransferase